MPTGSETTSSFHWVNFLEEHNTWDNTDNWIEWVGPEQGQERVRSHYLYVRDVRDVWTHIGDNWRVVRNEEKCNISLHY